MVIDGGMLGGLPAAGSNIGGMMSGVAPGAGAMILVPGIAYSVGGIPKAIAKGIERRAGVKQQRRARVRRPSLKKKPTRRKQTTRKPRRKPLTRRQPLIPTYKYPKLPKMGPY